MIGPVVILATLAGGGAMAFYEFNLLSPFFDMLGIGLTAAVYLKQRATELFLRRELNAIGKRSFEVTIGLWESYNNSKTHTMKEFNEAIGDWMKARSKKGLPILTGFSEEVHMIYPYRNKEKSTGPADEESVDILQEPSAKFSGSLSPKYDSSRSDAEVLNTLKSLALHLGHTFNQRRVYYSFLEVQYSEDVS